MKFYTLDKRLISLEFKNPDGWEATRLAIVGALDAHPVAKLSLASQLAEHRNQEGEDDDWPELRTFILGALARYPSAEESVYAALKEAGS